MTRADTNPVNVAMLWLSFTLSSIPTFSNFRSTPLIRFWASDSTPRSTRLHQDFSKITPSALSETKTIPFGAALDSSERGPVAISCKEDCSPDQPTGMGAGTSLHGTLPDGKRIGLHVGIFCHKSDSTITYGCEIIRGPKCAVTEDVLLLESVINTALSDFRPLVKTTAQNASRHFLETRNSDEMASARKLATAEVATLMKILCDKSKLRKPTKECWFSGMELNISKIALGDQDSDDLPTADVLQHFRRTGRAAPIASSTSRTSAACESFLRRISNPQSVLRPLPWSVDWDTEGVAVELVKADPDHEETYRNLLLARNRTYAQTARDRRKRDLDQSDGVDQSSSQARKTRRLPDLAMTTLDSSEGSTINCSLPSAESAPTSAQPSKPSTGHLPAARTSTRLQSDIPLLCLPQGDMSHQFSSASEGSRSPAYSATGSNSGYDWNSAFESALPSPDRYPSPNFANDTLDVTGGSSAYGQIPQARSLGSYSLTSSVPAQAPQFALPIMAPFQDLRPMGSRPLSGGLFPDQLGHMTRSAHHVSHAPGRGISQGIRREEMGDTLAGLFPGLIGGDGASVDLTQENWEFPLPSLHGSNQDPGRNEQIRGYGLAYPPPTFDGGEQSGAQRPDFNDSLWLNNVDAVFDFSSFRSGSDTQGI